MVSESTSPPANPVMEWEDCLEWIDRYLRPKALEGEGYRAHQFTINGLTFPFIQKFGVACVPEPPKSRRYDMLAGLHSARPGDLVFFFQADPQDPSAGINARRGIRGLWKVAGTPVRAAAPLRCQVDHVDYRLLDKCPSCGTVFSHFGPRCEVCRKDYPTVKIGGKDRVEPVLSCQLPITPVYGFNLAVSDERVYADFSDPGLVWVGRHDNAMGKGKGSSIRHLLPEEARKILRLLLRERGQTLFSSTSSAIRSATPLLHDNGRPIRDLPMDRRRVAAEDELYFSIVEQLKVNGSPFRVAIESNFPTTVTWENLEYVSPTFPWGYTAMTADLVLSFRSQLGRSFAVIVECKKGTAHDEAVLQTMLYVERVVQILSLSGDRGLVVPPESSMVVLPVVIAANRTTPRTGDPRLALPGRYEFERTYSTGTSVHASVQRPRFMCYAAASTTLRSEYCNAISLTFAPLDDGSWCEIDWKPDDGEIGTGQTIESILAGSWSLARGRAAV